MFHCSFYFSYSHCGLAKQQTTLSLRISSSFVVGPTILGLKSKGNPRLITITNSGKVPALNIAISVSPNSPPLTTGTSINPTLYSQLNPGQTASFVITPGEPNYQPGITESKSDYVNY